MQVIGNVKLGDEMVQSFGLMSAGTISGSSCIRKYTLGLIGLTLFSRVYLWIMSIIGLSE